MNIIERGRVFLQSLWELAGRSAWEWKGCLRCGSTLTIKSGSYQRHPWFLGRREMVRVQRHLCHGCSRSYSEQSALLVRGSRYAREVHRAASQAASGLTGEAAKQARQQARNELGGLMHKIMDAPIYAQAEAALAALVWAIYHNFEPAQWRSERKRHYRHPGQSALEVAGAPPEQ